MNILEDWKNKSGVYIISPFEPRKRKQFWCKVGVSQGKTASSINIDSSGIGQRVDQYLLYYPWGFYVLALYQTKKKDALELEQLIHNLLRSKKRQMDPNHSHTKEWFQLNLKDIIKMHNALITTSSKLIKHISFTDDPHIIDSNTRTPRQTKDVKFSSPLRTLHEASTDIQTNSPKKRTIKSNKKEALQSVTKQLDL